MNSSSEDVLSNSQSEPRPISYLPMEYREARELSDAGQSAASAAQPECAPPAEPASDPVPDPAEILAARVEQERQIITAQVRQDAEREIQRIRSEISRAIEQFGQQRDEYFRQAESEVVNLALAITRRLIHRETQMDPGLIAGLVNYELQQLDSATKVRLFVSPDMMNYWTEAARSMSRPVEVAVDKAVSCYDVRIDTALGSTTVSFERELKEIERGFFDLLSHRPPAAETRTVLVQ